MAGDAAPEGTPGAAPDPTEAAREEFLRQMLEAAERGVLGPDDYAARVRALESAASVADMVAIVTRPVGTAPGSTATAPALTFPTTASAGTLTSPMGAVAPAESAPQRTLDPVDLARMTAPASKGRRRSERSRYGALIAMAVIFLLLLVGGLLLASHVHAGGGAIGGGLGAAGLVAAPSLRAPTRT